MSKSSKKVKDIQIPTTIENATHICVLKLEPLHESPSGFNFDSQLFTQYLKSVL